jgi:hypothetical protein
MLVSYRQILFSFALAGVAALTGCSGSVPPAADPMLSGRIGDNCTVFFRHDALGMAAGSPASPTTGNHNGADVQVTGKLMRVNAGWVCVAVGKGEYTIPKEAILLVEMPSK